MTDDVATVPAHSTDPKRRSRGVLIFFRDILFIILAALVISFLIKTFLIRSFFIPSGSMEETLQIKDRVIVSLLTPGVTPLKRGDVIVFTDPGGWLEGDVPASNGSSSPVNDALAFLGLVAPDDNDHLIKRVIGLPGDRVMCCAPSGRIEVNGVPISEPFINQHKAGLPDVPTKFSITVPKGELWVLGDNRYDSEDSAYHYAQHNATPFVPLSDVTGRAMVISWPISRWKYLDDYQSEFKGAATAK